MIYTVLADYRRLFCEITDKEGGISSPFSLFPESLRDYVRGPKTDEGRLARLGGYLLLYHTVRFLFGKARFEIGFSEKGKPYFLSEDMKDLSFSISHSGGICAVSVSDGGESVGVDVQEEIDEERCERIRERLYSGELSTGRLLNTVYLFGGFSAYGDCMFAEIPPAALKIGDTGCDLTDRWTLTEAIMKWDGRGFGAYTELDSLAKESYSETLRLSYKGKRYSISTVYGESNYQTDD